MSDASLTKEQESELFGPRLSDMIEIECVVETHPVWSVLLPDDKRRPLGGVRCFSIREKAVAEARRVWPELIDDEIS